MFSKDNLRSLSLRFDFPAEEEKFLAEKIYENISLSVLKFKETGFLNIFIRVIEEIPLVQMTDSERGILLSITRNSIRLILNVERPPIIVEKGEEEKVLAKLFSEETLNGISNDLNFLLGRAIGLFEKKGLEIKTSGDTELKRKIEPNFSLDANFSKELIESVKEFGRIRFSGLTFELKNKSKVTRIDCETSKDEIVMNVRFSFPYKQTINISALINEVLEEVNLFCQKLRID